MFTVDNAVIMAAGTSSRFAPLSYEIPKALIEVKGEVLIERQIKQIRDAGIEDIYVVVGYKKEMFEYLSEKFGVKIVCNPSYNVRNNNSSIYAVRDKLKNTYICSADNYFSKNPFEKEVDFSYYSALFADGSTKEWCLQEDERGIITGVKIGGADSWYMLGHTFWDENFSKKFVEILEREYHLERTASLLWESIYAEHICELEMKIRKYEPDVIFEFDTLDELRQFDQSYICNTRSAIIKDIAAELGCDESDIISVASFKGDSNEAIGFTFAVGKNEYTYLYGKGMAGKRV